LGNSDWDKSPRGRHFDFGEKPGKRGRFPEIQSHGSADSSHSIIQKAVIGEAYLVAFAVTTPRMLGIQPKEILQ
jgi:hypothetical protein